MAASFASLANEFRRLIKMIGGSPVTPLRAVADRTYEAVVCAGIMNEYAAIYGKPESVRVPGVPLRARAGDFDSEKAFYVQFSSRVFYFQVNLLCYGLAAYKSPTPAGDVFGASVAVFDADHLPEITAIFNNIPAPQHLHLVAQCAFAHYDKAQLLGWLGFRRHLSYLSRPDNKRSEKYPFGAIISKSDPDIQVIFFRSVRLPFLTTDTATHYEIQQLIYP